MQFIVFFIGAFALANAGVMIEDHQVLDTPMERTSIVGPSGSIIHEKKIPFLETKLHEIETSVKVIKPEMVIAEPVHEAKTVVSVMKEEVPMARIETMAPLTHRLVTPMELSLYKKMEPFSPKYPSVPSWYRSYYMGSYPWYRSYYPYDNYYSRYFL